MKQLIMGIESNSSLSSFYEKNQQSQEDNRRNDAKEIAYNMRLDTKSAINVKVPTVLTDITKTSEVQECSLSKKKSSNNYVQTSA